MFAGDLFNPLRRKKMIVPFMIGERSGVVKRIGPGSCTLNAGRWHALCVDRSSVDRNSIAARKRNIPESEKKIFVVQNVLIAAARRCYSAPSSKRKSEAARSVPVFVNRAVTIFSGEFDPTGLGCIQPSKSSESRLVRHHLSAGFRRWSHI